MFHRTFLKLKLEKFLTSCALLVLLDPGCKAATTPRFDTAFSRANRRRKQSLTLSHCFLLPIRKVVSIPHSMKQCTRAFRPRPVRLVLCVLSFCWGMKGLDPIWLPAYSHCCSFRDGRSAICGNNVETWPCYNYYLLYVRNCTLIWSLLGALRRATSLLLIHLPTWSHEGNRIIGLLE